MVKDHHQYTKFYQANLGVRDPQDSQRFVSFNFGVLELHFDGNAIEVMEEAIRSLKEGIEFAKENPW